MMKTSKTIVFVLVSGMATFAASTCSDAQNGRDMLQSLFYGRSADDNVTDELAQAWASRTFDDEFGGVMSATGWGRCRILQELCDMMTNACLDVSVCSDPGLLYSYDGAVDAIGRYGTTNELCAIEYAIANGAVSRLVSGPCDAYVRIAGLTSSAFDFYIMMTSRGRNISANALYGAVFRRMDAFGCSAVETNRMHALMISVFASNRVAQVAVDAGLCREWPGYANSSNRLLHVSYALEHPMNGWVTNRLAEVQRLLQSSTNLVELSVEDFISE